jgi:hypothetical protein
MHAPTFANFLPPIYKGVMSFRAKTRVVKKAATTGGSAGACAR